MSAAGVVLENVEDVIKTVITEDDMLPEGYKTLQQDEWGVELADYFECVAGKLASALLDTVPMPSCREPNHHTR